MNSPSFSSILSGVKEHVEGLIVLDWSEFDVALHSLANQLSGRKFPCIYGEPRGGLVLAVCLGYRLDIPLSLTPQPEMLWCDDLIDSGETYRRVLAQFPQATFCTWVSKQPSLPVTHALNLECHKEWVFFPWEDQARIAVERQKYKARLSAEASTPNPASGSQPHSLGIYQPHTNPEH